jgi:exodeoxyribonuclease VII small subunit
MVQKKFNYKKSIEEIESIIKHIEAGEPDVDELSRLVKRAASLIAACRSKLQDTGKELDDVLRDFDAQDGPTQE